jgi:hypothetical protein
MNKTWLVLVESSVWFALAAALVVVRTLGSFGASAGLQIAAVSALSVFAVTLIISIILGFILKIIVTTLGGAGKYFEGLTVVAYALLPMAASLFVASIFALVPAGIVISAIAVALGFACGLSMLYRGIKELFRTDMVTALVAVSILIIVLLIAASVSMGFAALTRLSTIVPIR